MKNIINTIIISYIIGIVWGLYLKINIVFFYALILVCMRLFNGIVKKDRLKNMYRYLNLLVYKKQVVIFIIISLIACLYVKKLNSKYDNLYIDVSDQIDVVGDIEELYGENDYSNIYIINVKEIKGFDSKKYTKTKLLLYVDKISEIYSIGDVIEANCTYKNPEVARNYKGFNYKEYLKTKKIYGVLKVNDEQIKKVSNNKSFKNKFIANISGYIDTKIKMVYEENSDLIKGILIGEAEYISDKIKDDFLKSGIYHLLSLSGGNINIVIQIVMFIIVLCRINKIKRILFSNCGSFDNKFCYKLSNSSC